MSNSRKRREHLKLLQLRTWYLSRCILGHNWARFFVFCGGRGAGKSTDLQRFLVKQWKEKGVPFTWLRLTDAEVDKLKADKGKDAFEPIVKAQYPELNNLKLHGDNLYVVNDKEEEVLICRFKSLSTFHNDKGTALYDCFEDDWSYVFLDEMNKSSNARRTGDPVFQFANMLETLLRTKDRKIKVLMVGNLEGLSSMMAGCFNWIPLEGKFGIYKIRKHKAVIHYFDDTEAFKQKKANSTSNLIETNHSTFTNVIQLDTSLIRKKSRLLRPSYRIKFPDGKSFCVWEDQNQKPVITMWKGQPTSRTIAMAPHLDALYDTKLRNNIIDKYNYRLFYFRDLKTQELFRQALILINH